MVNPRLPTCLCVKIEFVVGTISLWTLRIDDLGLTLANFHQLVNSARAPVWVWRRLRTKSRQDYLCRASTPNYQAIFCSVDAPFNLWTLFLVVVMQGRIQPVMLGGRFQMVVKSHNDCYRRDEVYLTKLLWQNNGRKHNLISWMLFSKFCTKLFS